MSTQEATISAGEETADQYSGAYFSFLILAAMAYVLMLGFVFAYGIFGEKLTAGVDSACAEAAFKAGKEQEVLGNYDLAIQRYRQALQGTFPDIERQYQCQRSIGELESLLGRYEEAIQWYRSLPADALSQPGHYAAFVTALRQAGNEDAVSVAAHWADCAAAVGDVRQQVWAHTTMGQILEEKQRPDEAFAAYEDAVRLDGQCQAVILSAKILQARGKQQEAVARLDEFLERVKSGQLHEDAAKFKKDWQAESGS
jgi:tetratricopeptide (TPR) repeat protein